MIMMGPVYKYKFFSQDFNFHSSNFLKWLLLSEGLVACLVKKSAKNLWASLNTIAVYEEAESYKWSVCEISGRPIDNVYVKLVVDL